MTARELIDICKDKGIPTRDGRAKALLRDKILEKQSHEMQLASELALPASLIRRIVRYMWTFTRFDTPKLQAYRQLLQIGLVSKEMFRFVSERMFVRMSVEMIADMPSKAKEINMFHRSFRAKWSPIKHIKYLDVGKLGVMRIFKDQPEEHLSSLLANVRRLVIDNLQNFGSISECLPNLEHLDVNQINTSESYGLLLPLEDLTTLRLGLRYGAEISYGTFNFLHQYLMTQNSLTHLALAYHQDMIDLSMLFSVKTNIINVEFHPYNFMPAFHRGIQTLAINDFAFTWDQALFTAFSFAHPSARTVTLTFKAVLLDVNLYTLSAMQHLHTLNIIYTCSYYNHYHVSTLLQQITASLSIQAITLTLNDHEVTNKSIEDLEEWSQCARYLFRIAKVYNTGEAPHKIYFQRIVWSPNQ
eukprot:gene12971-15246_t